VETPEERRRQKVAAAIHHADALLDQPEESFYVLVPADSSQPLQECSFRPARTTAGDALLKHLQSTTLANPSTGKDIDLELLRQHSPTQTLANLDLTVSDQTLREVAQQAHIETFTLVHPTPGNQFTSITIYLDEAGLLKRLPLNPRASHYCARAGYNPPPVFYGNVCLGRMRQQQSAGLLRNESFRLGPDTALDASWLLAATAENLQHQRALNERTGQSGVRQVGVAGSDGLAKVEADGAYRWTQTESELELVMPLPADAVSKLVRVQFQPLLLTIRYTSASTPLLLELPLFERIDVDAGTWTLEASDDDSDPHKRLIVSMEKGEAAYWPRIRD
jgi:CS domain